MTDSQCAHIDKQRPGFGSHYVHISFDGYGVAIYSEASEVLDEVRRSFSAMIKPLWCEPATTFEVGSSLGYYHLRHESDPPKKLRFLFEVTHDLKHAIVSGLMAARPDLLWFHAAAIACRGHAVMMPGGGGSGKSSLAASLVNRGWMYLSDDLVPLNPQNGEVLPLPFTPMVRQRSAQHLPSHLVRTLSKSRVYVRSDKVSRQATSLTTLIFPTYKHKSPTILMKCSPSAAAIRLVESCISSVTAPDMALMHVCHLAERIPSFALSFDDVQSAATSIAEAHDGVGN